MYISKYRRSKFTYLHPTLVRYEIGPQIINELFNYILAPKSLKGNSLHAQFTPRPFDCECRCYLIRNTWTCQCQQAGSCYNFLVNNRLIKAWRDSMGGFLDDPDDLEKRYCDYMEKFLYPV